MPSVSPRRLIALAALAGLAACAERPGEPSTPDEEGVVPLQSTDPLALAREIPQFGGYYLDADGTPVMFLTEGADEARARRAAVRSLRAGGAAAATESSLRIRRAEYRYLDLHEWHRGISPEALDVDGVVFTDLDEARNRVTIGVEAFAAEGAVRAAAARLGVPPDAVVIERVEPIGFAATLREQVRPVQGGLQINFGNYVCTIGFNASHSAGASFITNSHCTDRQGGTEGTLYYQPASNVAGSFIATEAADPAYSRSLSGCPRGKSCRYSDAARAAYASGVSTQLGRIARTTGVNTGSLTIDGFFTITGEYGSSNVTVGTTVNKVGRTTGWTRGNVTNTCVNTSVSGSKLALLCQTFVSAGVNGGDSGSPVFTESGGNATLYGILWGGNSSGTQFVFSPLNQVEQELGALTTF